MALRGLASRADMQTTLVLLPIDLAFRFIVYFPTTTMWTLEHRELRNAAFAWAYLGTLPLLVLWIAAFSWILAPVERWRTAQRRGNAHAALLRAATDAIYRAPLRLTLAFTAQWTSSTAFSYFLVRSRFPDMPLAPGAETTMWLAVVTVAFGATAVAFTATSWRLANVTNEISLAARNAGIAIRGPALSLRQRIGLVALCISSAPALWVTALACTEHFRGPDTGPDDPFGTMMPFVLAGCAVFALLCAWMFAATLTSPIAQMHAVVAELIKRGDVRDVGRLPVQQRDELGALAESVNAMIDHLELVERARHQIAAHLAELNVQLEAQVQQRTQSLATANDQLRREIAERERMEIELRLAQKLDALGRLASGVAHEINTPVQYVTDSLLFVRDALQDLSPVIGKYREVVREATGAHAPLTMPRSAAQAAAEASALADSVDVDYVLDNLTPALARSLDGLDRVTSIVRSMKHFAHPDRAAASEGVDLNETVRSALEIARHEYKYVADLTTELGDLPAIRAYPGELSQVILNLVVNAAHAIGDVIGESGGRGRIVVKTWADAEHVWLSVGDTGGGIPEDIRASIFDPFFTTKEVGRGTGQGLAIVHGVVNKHHGDVRFTTEVGRGTTFTVRLPTDFARALA